MFKQFCQFAAFFFATQLLAQKNDSLAIVQRLDSLTLAAQQLGIYGDMETAFEMVDKAEREALVVFGSGHYAYGNAIFKRGILNFYALRFEDAIASLSKAKAIFENTVGRFSKAYAACTNTLGTCYMNVGQLSEAADAYRLAMEVFKQLGGAQSADYLKPKSNLVNVLRMQENYDEARSMVHEILEARAELVGKMHPDYAKNLNQLAIIYGSEGRYEDAEPLFLQVNEINEKTLGTDHYEYASGLMNLASVYSETWRLAEAERLFLKTGEIIEKTMGKSHPNYAEILNNLGTVYQNMEQYEAAAQAYLECLELREKLGAREHPLYAGTLINLATVYTKTSQFDKAETMLATAHEINEKLLGKNSVQYANGIVSEALLFALTGRYGEAETRLMEAIAIYEANKITAHVAYDQLLDQYANLLFLTHRAAEAIATKKRALQVQQQISQRATSYMGEQELSNFIHLFADANDYVLSCNLEFPSHQAELAATCFDNLLFDKGFLQTSVRKVQALARGNPASEEMLRELGGLQRLLAAQYATPIAERNTEAVAKLEAQARDAEKALVLKVADYEQAVRQTTWQEVQSKLQSGEAAIEFVNFNKRFPNPTDSLLYAALVLLPDAPPAFVPLFEEKQLETLLKRRKYRRSDYVNDLYGDAKNELYDLIWRPLEASLKDISTVYFSPSGLLHRINLGAIHVPGKTNEPLANWLRFVQVGSTRQLATSNADAVWNNQAALYGGIQYDVDSTELPQLSGPLLASRSRGELDFSGTDSTLRGGKWSYLNWAEKEVENLKSIFQAAGLNPVLRNGSAATEESFKDLGNGQSPRILHLATHGYFFPDPSSVGSWQPAADSQAEPAFKMSEHPMIRSGLVLAGGNHAWATGKPLRPDLEDGILTAYEISQMDLSNTELVVLSACETGLGDIAGNEGVYGLQRAFKIAGAKYLVMSLWQVPDQQTQELMTAFYNHWLVNKMSIPDALRTAQRAIQERYGHPFFWAGFVLLE